MAHLLRIENDATTLDLNVATDAGYHFVRFRPPRLNRLMSRIAPAPGSSGHRTVGAAIGDSDVEIVLLIVGTSVANAEFQLKTLTVMLEQASLWGERKVGTPVRLSWRQDGAMSTSFRIITAVSAMPEAIDPGGAPWLQVSRVSFMLVVSFTVTLEPYWHKDGVITHPPVAVTNGPVANVATVGSMAITEMVAPLAIAAELTTYPTGAQLHTLYLLHMAGDATAGNFSGTANGSYYGGSYAEKTVTGTELLLGEIQIASADLTAYPFRVFTRLAVASGSPAVLRLRAVPTINSVPLTSPPWLPFHKTGTQIGLIDLGSVSLANLLHTIPAYTYLINIALYGKTTDGTTLTLRMDYGEAVPYKGMTILKVPPNSATVGMIEDDVAHYSDVGRSGTFHFPLTAPRASQEAGAITLYQGPLDRRGRLHGLDSGETASFWVAAENDVDENHRLTDQITLTVAYLAQYALGMYGTL